MLSDCDKGSSGEGRPVVAIDEQAIGANARAIGYAIALNFIDEHMILRSALGGMRPAKLVVYLVIVLATVQKYLRSPTSDNRGIDPMIEADCAQISRRAIAESTGIPRENVRRIVRELLEEGRIVEAPGGFVRQPPGFMLDPAIGSGVLKMLSGLTKTMQTLVDSKVVRINYETTGNGADAAAPSLS